MLNRTVDDVENGPDGEFYRRVSRYHLTLAEIEEELEYEGGHKLPSLPPHPWERITWTIELAHSSPAQALQVIQSYMDTHFTVLPDGRIDALGDAAALIRARYIGKPEHVSDRISLLLGRDPYDLEDLSAALYREMGYRCTVTPRSHDRNRDVIATRDGTGERERVFIQCKREKKTVGIGAVQRLAGTIVRDNPHGATRGVLITTSTFSPAAKREADPNPRLELVNGSELVLMLNEYLGHDWPMRLEAILVGSKHLQGK